MALQLPPQLSLERRILGNLLVSGFIFVLSNPMLSPSGLEWRYLSPVLVSHERAGRETKAICPSTNTWEPGVTSQKNDPHDASERTGQEDTAEDPLGSCYLSSRLLPSEAIHPIDSDTLSNRPRHTPKLSLLELPAW